MTQNIWGAFNQLLLLLVALGNQTLLSLGKVFHFLQQITKKVVFKIPF